MTLLSFSALPILMSLVIAAIILALAMFGHLQFKHVSIRKVSLAASILTIPFVVFYFQLLERLVFDYNANILHIHVLLSALMFLVVMIFGFFTVRRVANIWQIIGIGLFAVGCFFLLA